ncbi:ABC transporter ATP-binding protein [Euzebya tangerina]|uniref:ABC transporter ATP-binding protein n=1 Tax=Euzebya tangerina TaxID=591198 RepID=UPI00196A899F|nr:ATP-binding cassette domain-containing protein [Euzebya tangerina]
MSTDGLVVQGVRKRYGPVVANDGVSFTVAPGSLHGLIGENGAGKSTVVGIISGGRRADAGTIALDGRVLGLSDPGDGLAAGIGLLHQDPMVFGPLTVLENFQLGGTGGLRLGAGDSRRRLRDACEQLGFELDPDAIVRTLTVGERQQLEIARLMDAGARVLILDEPTTAISADQRVALFAALRRLAAEGLSVIYVTHKLEELDQLCDTVTVMRAGRVVGTATLPVPDTELVAMMFGEPPAHVARPQASTGAALLRMTGVDATDGAVRVSDVDLTVRAGEVIGLAGMEGSGQRTILMAAAGAVTPQAGSVELTGRADVPLDVAALTAAARRAEGVEWLPADRLAEGLIPGLTLAEHATLAGAVAPRRGWRRMLTDPATARSVAAESIATYRIKARPESTPEQLSGGNQQRVLLSLIDDDARLIMMEHPTRGLDIESAEWVWQQLGRRAASGSGIVFASSDLDELQTRADRILVCFDGRVIAEVDPDGTSADALGYLIGGRSAPPGEGTAA